MKKFGILALGLMAATAITVNAADGDKKKKEQTPEQKKLMEEILKTYDANKDGKLDADERAKISAEDKEKMSKAGLGGGKKKDK